MDSDRLESLKCPKCSCDYNLNDRLPHNMPSCGHTFCTNCINYLLTEGKGKCPLDETEIPKHRASIEAFSVSHTVTAVLRELYKIDSEELCSKHNEKKKLACIDDRVFICSECALFGNHNRCKVKPSKELEAEVKEKLEDVDDALYKWDKHYDDLQYVIQQTRVHLVDYIKDSFDEMRKLLDRKEKELIEDCHHFFDERKYAIMDKFKTNSSIRNTMLDKIRRLEDIRNDDEFFDALEENTSMSFLLKFTNDELRENVDRYEDKLCHIIEEFRILVNKNIDDLTKLKLPESELCALEDFEHFKKYNEKFVRDDHSFISRDRDEHHYDRRSQHDQSHFASHNNSVYDPEHPEEFHSRGYNDSYDPEHPERYKIHGHVNGYDPEHPESYKMRGQANGYDPAHPENYRFNGANGYDPAHPENYNMHGQAYGANGYDPAHPGNYPVNGVNGYDPAHPGNYLANGVNGYDPAHPGNYGMHGQPMGYDPAHPENYRFNGVNGYDPAHPENYRMHGYVNGYGVAGSANGGDIRGDSGEDARETEFVVQDREMNFGMDGAQGRVREEAHTRHGIVRKASDSDSDHDMTEVEKVQASMKVCPTVEKRESILMRNPDIKTTLRFVEKDDYLEITSAVMEPCDPVIGLYKFINARKVVVRLEKYTMDEIDILVLQYVWEKLQKVYNLKIECVKEASPKDLLKKLYPILFSKTHHLRTVKFDLENALVDDDDIIHIANEIPLDLPEIKHLGMLLQKGKITQKSIKVFIQKNIKAISTLESLTLGFQGVEMVDDDLAGLFVAMPNMKNFNLDLSETAITDKTLNTFVNNTVPSLTHLERFKLGLWGTPVTNAGLKPVFRNMAGVRTFLLDIGGTKVTGESLESLAVYGPDTYNVLEDFELHLDNSGLGDKELGMLFNNMRSVKRFVLNLDSTKVTDASIKILTDKVIPSFKTLESFKISLSKTKVTNAGAIKLLQSLKKAKEFIVDFRKVKLTNQMAQEFLDLVVPEMSNVKSFMLDLTGTLINEELLAKIKKLESEYESKTSFVTGLIRRSTRTVNLTD